jgi:hypothetical protein
MSHSARDAVVKRAPRKAVRAGVAIEPEDQFTQAEGRGGKGSQAGLDSRHEERGRNALIGNICDNQEQAAVSLRSDCHGRRRSNRRDSIDRPGGEREVDALERRRRLAYEPALDLTGDLEIALHRETIG